MFRTNSMDFLPCLQQRSAAFFGDRLHRLAASSRAHNCAEQGACWTLRFQFRKSAADKGRLLFWGRSFHLHKISCLIMCHSPLPCSQCWTYILTLSFWNPGGRGTRWQHFVSSFQFIELSPCPISCFASLPLSVPVFFFLGPCFIKMIIFGRWLGM